MKQYFIQRFNIYFFFFVPGKNIYLHYLVLVYNSDAFYVIFNLCVKYFAGQLPSFIFVSVSSSKKNITFTNGDEISSLGSFTSIRRTRVWFLSNRMLYLFKGSYKYTKNGANLV